MPEPMAMPTLDSIKAGASLMPSPTSNGPSLRAQLAHARHFLIWQQLGLHLVDS
jgi:hypothetical protein